MKRSRLIVIAASMATLSTASADPNAVADSEEGFGGNLFQRVFSVFERVRDIGPWDQQHGDVMVAVENVFATNNWDSESDLFSMDLIREVGSIPPWQPEQRVNHLVEVLGDRYGFDERQSKLVRNTIIRESNKMFFRHAPTALAYSLEIVETRASGEPFTPDQVARWTEMAMPIFQDAHANFKDVVTEILPEFTPEQQALALEDMAANDRRFEVVLEGAERWKRGEWKASDWGMQDDPIQMAQIWAAEDAAADELAKAREAELDEQERLNEREARLAQNREREVPVGDVTRRQSRSTRSARPTPTRNERRSRPAVSSNPARSNDPWERHVQAFIDRYKLTDSQQTAAWRIYRDASQRRDTVRNRHDSRLTSLEAQLSSQPERLEKQKASIVLQRDQRVDVLFEQMNDRLDRLPTRTQRQAALAKPHKSAKKPGAKKSPTN